METLNQTELQSIYGKVAVVGRRLLEVAKESDDYRSNPPLFTLEVIPSGLSQTVVPALNEVSIKDVQRALAGTIEIGLREAFAVIETRPRSDTMRSNIDLLTAMITSLNQVQGLFGIRSRRYAANRNRCYTHCTKRKKRLV